MKIAALYTRVSTGNQEKEETILSQLAEVKERIVQDGLILGDGLSFSDDGWSGSILARPALDRLRDAAKNKLFQALYVYDIGRLSRNYTDQLVLIAEIQKYGITIVSLKDVVSSDDDGDDSKWLHSRVVGMFQEFERRKISDRFRRGKMYKADMGILFGWNPPYGYMYIKGDKSKSITGSFQIHEDEARVVRTIFQWFTEEQLTIRQIITRLYELKIRPRKNKKEYWATSTLSRLLRDKTYTGTTFYNKNMAVEATNPHKKDGYRRIKKTSRKTRSVDEWKPIAVPVIIDSVVFSKAQEQLKVNTQFSERNKVNEYLLSTLIRCTCGSTRCGGGTKEHLYYRCTDRQNRFPLPQECTAYGVNASVLDTEVWNGLHNLLTDPKNIEAQYDTFKIRLTSSQNSSEYVDVDKLKRDLDDLKVQEDRFVKAYGAKVISLEQLQGQLADIKLKKGQIMGKLTTSRSDTPMEQDSVILPDLKLFSDTMRTQIENADFREKQHVVRNIIDVVVTDGVTATVEGSIPLAIPEENSLINYEQSSINRYCRVAKRRKINAFQRAPQKTSCTSCELSICNH